MKILFDEDSWDDYIYWQNTEKKIFKKINELIKEIQRTPYSGSGKPEPLKFNFSGYWSRRINHEHRLVYKVEDNVVYIVQCKYHY